MTKTEKLLQETGVEYRKAIEDAIYFLCGKMSVNDHPEWAMEIIGNLLYLLKVIENENID